MAVDQALAQSRRQGWALTGMVFFAVAREGLESVFFLLAAFGQDVGIAAPLGALALKAGAGQATAGNVPQAPEGALPGTLSPDDLWERQPCFGRHQAGIVTPQQAAMMLVAFDVLAD